MDVNVPQKPKITATRHHLYDLLFHLITNVSVWSSVYTDATDDTKIELFITMDEDLMKDT